MAEKVEDDTSCSPSTVNNNGFDEGTDDESVSEGDDVNTAVVNTGSGTKKTPSSNFWLFINMYKTLYLAYIRTIVLCIVN